MMDGLSVFDIMLCGKWMYLMVVVMLMIGCGCGGLFDFGYFNVRGFVFDDVNGVFVMWQNMVGCLG